MKSQTSSSVPMVSLQEWDAADPRARHLATGVLVRPDTVVVPDASPETVARLREGFRVVLAPTAIRAMPAKDGSDAKNLLISLTNPQPDRLLPPATCGCPEGDCRADQALKDPAYSLWNFYSDMHVLPPEFAAGPPSATDGGEGPFPGPVPIVPVAPAMEQCCFFIWFCGNCH